MTNNIKFIYMIYIKTTPEKIWHAITNPYLTKQYWGGENISDWREGSRWRHVADDSKSTIELVGEVMRVIPNKLLILTWAAPAHIFDDSCVTLTIEHIRDGARLKVIHDDFKNDSQMPDKIRESWPRVLSSMKS